MKRIVFTLALLFISLYAFSQPGPPPDATPLDGGLSLLIAAGAVYGAKRVNDIRKSNMA